MSETTRDRALELLGEGVAPSQVASCLGVEVSRISQLLSEPEFSAKVAELRFFNLRKHSARDNKYDAIEDDLLDRLKDCLGFMIKPQEILRAIQVINQAKRRGSSAPEAITSQTQIVQLNIPAALVQKFQVNITNTVVKAGDQSLETIQSGVLLDMSKQSDGNKKNERYIEKLIEV